MALLAVLLCASASAAGPAVEFKVTEVAFDTSARPYITEVSVELTNRSAAPIEACQVELRYLDAKGEVVWRRPHPLGRLGLAPGASIVASFQDLDPPAAWDGRVEASGRCSS